jgi:hypothetical protein
MTDFDSPSENYAGLFTCKEKGDSLFYSVTFLSRTRTLDSTYVNKMKAILDKYKIDYSTLETQQQDRAYCLQTGKYVAPITAALYATK